MIPIVCDYDSGPKRKYRRGTASQLAGRLPTVSISQMYDVQVTKRLLQNIFQRPGFLNTERRKLQSVLAIVRSNISNWNHIRNIAVCFPDLSKYIRMGHNHSIIYYR